MGHWLYLVGLALVMGGFLIGRLRAGNSVRARDISGGNLAVGNISGTLSQTVQPAAADAGKPKPATDAGKPDRVAWLIAIVGVLVAAAQLAHDVLAAK